MDKKSSTLEIATQFLMTHTERVIEVLGAIVLLLFAVALFLAFRRSSRSESSTGGGLARQDLERLEESLRGMIKSTAVAAGETVAAVPAARQEEEVRTLRAALAAKEKQIAEIASGPAAGGTVGGGGAEAASYREKIAALETRLAEYEIIEDDIADLASFKEENRKLKQELTKLQGGAEGAVSMMTPLPVDGASKAPAPIMTNDPKDLVAEFEAAVSAEVSPAVPVSPTVPASTSAPTPVAEVAPVAAIATPAATPAATPTPAAEAASATASAAPTAAPTPNEAAIADEILAEFSAAITETPVRRNVAAPSPVASNETTPASVADEEIDTEKMLAEVVSFDPSQLENLSIDPATALEEESDVDKMADEATGLSRG